MQILYAIRGEPAQGKGEEMKPCEHKNTVVVPCYVVTYTGNYYHNEVICKDCGRILEIKESETEPETVRQ